MKNPKTTVERRIFIDGVRTNELTENRVVYTRKDGTQYIRDWQGQKAVTVHADGTLSYEVHSRTVRVMTFAQFAHQTRHLS